MVRTIRKIGKRVDFNFEEKDSVLKSGNEIKKEFSEIKKLVNRTKKIDSRLKNKKIKVIEKEKLIDEKKENTRKIIDLWNDLRRADLNNLKKEEFARMLNSQKNFIDDLLDLLVNKY